MTLKSTFGIRRKDKKRRRVSETGSFLVGATVAVLGLGLITSAANSLNNNN